MNIKNNKGTILIISYLVIAVLLILSAAFLSRSISENRIAERQKWSVRAFSIAEAGLERALYDLRQDFKNDLIDPSWADGEINGIACGPDSENFYSLPYESTLLGNGSYSIELKNVVGKDNEIWVRSMGTLNGINIIIQSYGKIENLSPWNNAIFAGAGSAGSMINGNVDIRGSVHILGTGLESDDFAIDMGGSGNIGNNYEGIPLQLKDRIPPCPTTTFNGETVETLGASLRIKRGLVGLSGTATTGKADVSGNSYKETMDGVYVTDGYGGNRGENNVYSDNGTQNSYDLGDSARFPSLEDPYLNYSTYQDYLKDNAFVISDAANLNQLANITPESDFSYGDTMGSISMDGNGNLAISGTVYIDGGNLNMNKIGADKTIIYSGTGSILVTGDVGINVNLLTQGSNSFPSNILGIMTPNEISFNASNIDVMGVFYAEDTITVQKQTNIAGIIVSNYFNMGEQVPSIYQVPEVINNLPSGIIAGDPTWVIRIVAWQKL
ncbi:MAG: hypothetical protein KKD90_07610 [Candidatus Omnitrophica bacterium]|nr:hypothetical protein [Candidatus Omnitrophota bacterium]MBU4149369.1 hypothetical protein [Candidatus Omnitrophota bacterium]